MIILVDRAFSDAAQKFQETFKNFQAEIKIAVEIDIDTDKGACTYYDLLKKLNEKIAESYPIYHWTIDTLFCMLQELKENISEEDSFMMETFKEESEIIHKLISEYMLLTPDNLIDNQEKKIMILQSLKQRFNKIDNYFIYTENLEKRIYLSYVNKIKSALPVLSFIKKNTSFIAEIGGIKEQIKKEYANIARQKQLFTSYIAAIKELKSECITLLEIQKKPEAKNLLKGITHQPVQKKNEDRSYIPSISFVGR